MSWNVDEINENALRLLCVDGLGGATLSKLVVAAGGINEAGDALESGQATDWLPRGASEMLRERMLRMEVEPARCSAEAIAAKIVLVTDDDFPQLLSPLPACPAALWYLGSLEGLSLASVGIVGSRRCTNYGIEQASLFSKEIVQSDLTVISGGARGIDAAAHRTAIQHGGSTAVVLGSGLSVAYPIFLVEIELSRACHRWSLLLKLHVEAVRSLQQGSPLKSMGDRCSLFRVD
jgi:DNA processing protein